MRESTLTERLDDRELLSDARGPGVYAVDCVVPDATHEVREAWDNYHDAYPGEEGIERLAAASDTLYVGASSNCYRRLCEHVRGDTRQTAFVGTFPIRRVVGVWPSEEPFTQEYNRAVKLARTDGQVVWCDGAVYG